MFITINNISAVEDFSVEHKEGREPKINIVKTKFIINTYQIVDISSSSNYTYDWTVIDCIDSRCYPFSRPITRHKLVDLKIQIRTIKMSNGDMFTITDEEFKKIIPLLSQEC